MPSRQQSREKRELAAEYLDQGYGGPSVAKLVGVTANVAENWVYTYRNFGKEALLADHQYTKYDIDTRLAAVTDVIEGGMSISESAAKHGVRTPSQVGTWVRQYRDGGIDAIVPKKRGRKRKEPKVYATREEELEARVQELELELEIQKRINALADGRSS